MGLSLTPLLAFISLAKLIAFTKAALGLGFVIFVHELGHFVVAKLCGVKCEKFYVGFDVPIRIGPIRFPRALFRKQWGETEYGIGIVPLGGYVKMLGQDDNPANSAKEAERIRQVREDAGGDEQLDSHHEIDPRSYPAKTVLQRLMIISAGVIMNLIFAVIFGMVAYRMGVTYTPTVVGSTSPGLSAWEVGLQSGDRIVQMGRDGEPSEHLRFTNDMMVKVMMTGANRQLDLLVDRYTAPGEPEKAPEWITVNLSNPQKEMQGRPIIGIGMPATNVVASNEELQTLFGHLPAYQVESPLQQGERIVAVDGVPVSDYAQLSRELAQRIDQPITLTLERPAAAEAAEGTPERRDVTVAPTPGRELGLHLTAGPIVSIQQGSIAEQAGLKVGDRLLEINGETVGDPMRIPDQLRRRVGTPVELRVARPGQDEPLVVSLVPRQPTMYHSASGLGQALPVEAAGFAFTIENRVAGIVPGSAAATSGIQVGDVVQAAEFEAANEQAAELESELFRSKQPIELGEEELSWPRVHDRLRFSQPETRVLLTYQRGDQLKTATLLPASTADWHYADRGLNLMTMEEVHQVEQWGTAFTLGVRETYESMRQVYFILFRLISGQLSPKNLGGPASIATMAGMEASESTARLLVFLTLLSANLAVVNFLPIPVLDGGHAMFLLYEGIFRKPINERVAFGLTMVGFCFVLGLMLFVIGLDFWRFSGLSG